MELCNLLLSYYATCVYLVQIVHVQSGPFQFLITSSNDFKVSEDFIHTYFIYGACDYSKLWVQKYVKFCYQKLLGYLSYIQASLN